MSITKGWGKRFLGAETGRNHFRGSGPGLQAAADYGQMGWTYLLVDTSPQRQGSLHVGSSTETQREVLAVALLESFTVTPRVKPPLQSPRQIVVVYEPVVVVAYA